MARPDKPGRFYMDANCWCHWASKRSPEVDIIETWFEAVQAKKTRLFASAFMLTEARGGGRETPNPAAEQRIRDFLLNPAVLSLVNADRKLCLNARNIALTTKAKNWDAIHLASAIQAKADVFLTYNTRDFPMQTLYQGVWVDEPYSFGGPTLFDS